MVDWISDICICFFYVYILHLFCEICKQKSAVMLVIFVFLLYFVINMVGVVGVGSVVMSVAVSVCGRFSPSHTP